MNIALSTLILFFLILPGVIFRRLYYSEEFSKQYFKTSFFSIFISSFLPSIAIHGLWLLLIAPLFNYKINFHVLFNLFSENPSITSINNIQKYFTPIISYHLTLLVFAGFMGFIVKQFIRFNKFDRKYKLLRFQNSWHYILTGEFFDFPRANFNLKKTLLKKLNLFLQIY